MPQSAILGKSESAQPSLLSHAMIEHSSKLTVSEMTSYIGHLKVSRRKLSYIQTLLDTIWQSANPRCGRGLLIRRRRGRDVS